MRGLAFSDSGPPLDEATVIDLVTVRTRSPNVVRFNFYEQASHFWEVRSISRGADFLEQRQKMSSMIQLFLSGVFPESVLVNMIFTSTL